MVHRRADEDEVHCLANENHANLCAFERPNEKRMAEERTRNLSQRESFGYAM